MGMLPFRPPLFLPAGKVYIFPSRERFRQRDSNQRDHHWRRRTPEM